MDTVGIKVISRNEINHCIKILRKYCKLSIGEIKEAIIIPIMLLNAVM